MTIAIVNDENIFQGLASWIQSSNRSCPFNAQNRISRNLDTLKGRSTRYKAGFVLEEAPTFQRGGTGSNPVGGALFFLISEYLL